MLYQKVLLHQRQGLPIIVEDLSLTFVLSFNTLPGIFLASSRCLGVFVKWHMERTIFSYA